MSTKTSVSINTLEAITNGRTLKFWEDEEYTKSHFNDGTGIARYMCEATRAISRAINLEFKKEPLHILEVGSGSGKATKMISDELSKNRDIKLVATDMNKYEPSDYPIEQLLSHDAVKKYGSTIDILFIIRPPPEGYLDYYAIKEYEMIKSSKPKYVLFVGEMGQADGCDEIHDYMHYDSNWNCIDYTELMSSWSEPFVFLFKLSS